MTAVELIITAAVIFTKNILLISIFFNVRLMNKYYNIIKNHGAVKFNQHFDNRDELLIKSYIRKAKENDKKRSNR